jgi:protein SCO1/2
MTTRTLRTLLWTGFFLALTTFAYTLFFDTQHYEVKGRVAGLRDDTTLVVEHERIPGYMPPMTMPVPVKDPSLLDGLAPGDAIQFRLQVTEEVAQITRLQSITDSLVARHPAQSESMTTASGAKDVSILREGEMLPPDLTLTNQNSEPVRMGDFRGKVLVLTFIYTRCPLPTYCPRMSKQFATLQPKLRSTHGPKVHLLSISFDPEYDTPQILRDYAARYTDRLDTWTFATGDSTQIERATGLFGIYTEQADGQITHNLVTAVVGPDGTVRRLFRGNDWTPNDVTRAVEQAL